MNIVTCPECLLPAEITDRYVLESTDGPVECVRVVCVGKHWFNGDVQAILGGGIS